VVSVYAITFPPQPRQTPATNMFGPSRPHWLTQATHGSKRRQDKDGKTKMETYFPPPVAMYTNAVYYFNQRALSNELPSSLRADIISHVFYAFASLVFHFIALRVLKLAK
jgi:hypothetical protein